MHHHGQLVQRNDGLQLLLLEHGASMLNPFLGFLWQHFSCGACLLRFLQVWGPLVVTPHNLEFSFPILLSWFPLWNSARSSPSYSQIPLKWIIYQCACSHQGKYCRRKITRKKSQYVTQYRPYLLAKTLTKYGRAQERLCALAMAHTRWRTYTWSGGI